MYQFPRARHLFASSPGAKLKATLGVHASAETCGPLLLILSSFNKILYLISQHQSKLTKGNPQPTFLSQPQDQHKPMNNGKTQQIDKGILLQKLASTQKIAKGVRVKTADSKPAASF